MEMATFNVDDGFLEALARGYRGKLLTQDDYQALQQADTIEDLKMHLSTGEFDYAPFLEEVQDLNDCKTLEKTLKKAVISDFHFLRAQATYPLSQFLDYITYGFMIENLCLLIKGCIKGDDKDALIASCNPLGIFPEMVMVCHVDLQGPDAAEDIYECVLGNTPLGPYFLNYVDPKDLKEINADTMKDRLYKEYLTDFYRFCTVELGGTTGEVMGGLLEFEADRRAINIAVNSIVHHEISDDEKLKMNPPFGTMFPEGFQKIAAEKDEEGIYTILQKDYSDTYGPMVDEMKKTKDTSAERYIEEVLMESEVHLNELAFYEQFHYGIFYSFLKLKEQEIRNIVWIAECILQHKFEKKLSNVMYIFAMATE
jgi:V-type H+-transporting ATPase subunit d